MISRRFILRLWYANAGIALAAAIVLLVGLLWLGDSSAEGTLAATRGSAASDADAVAKGMVDPNERTDSPLITVVKLFSKRLAPPPPPPVPPPPPPSPPPSPPLPPRLDLVVPKPEPPKPNPPKSDPPKPDPPKRIVPKPTFSVTGTIVIGEQSGLAWVVRKGKEKAFWVGETVGEYKIERVFDGKVELSREGETFNLDVPKPSEVKVGSAKSKVKPAKSKAKRKRPRRRGRRKK